MQIDSVCAEVSGSTVSMAFPVLLIQETQETLPSGTCRICRLKPDAISKYLGKMSLPL